MDEIGEKHGRWKFKIQASTLEAERRRDDALAGTVVTLENFRHATAESAGALEELARSARRAFGGCGRFRRLLSPKRKWPELDLAPDENQLFEQQRQLQEKIRGNVGRFKKMPLPLIFRFIPVWLVALLFLAGAAVLVMEHFAVKMIVPPSGAAVVTASAFVLLAVYFFGLSGAGTPAKTISGDLAKARRLLDTAAEKAELRYQQEQERIKTEYATTVQNLNQEWRSATKGAIESRSSRPVSIDEQAMRIYKTHERQHLIANERLGREHAEILARLRQDFDADKGRFSEAHAAKMEKLKTGFQSSWAALEADWKNFIQPLHDKIQAANAGAEVDFSDWNSGVWKNWTPPQVFKNAAKFARLEVDAGRAGRNNAKRQTAVAARHEIFRAAVAGVSARRLDTV